MVLVCNTSQNLIVTWSREDGRPLPNTPDGNVLRIEMPGVEDGGVYRCSADDMVATFNLVVVERPPTASEKLTYDVLMTVLVVHACHCEAQYHLTPSCNWFLIFHCTKSLRTCGLLFITKCRTQ